MRELTFEMVTDLDTMIDLHRDITEYCDEHDLDPDKITEDLCVKVMDIMISAREIMAVHYDDLWEDTYKQMATKFWGYDLHKEEKRVEKVNDYIEDHYEEVEFGGTRWMIKIK